MCEEACPTHAIQLTPDFEMCTADREELVYEKDRLLVEGMGKYPGYDFYRRAGVATPGKHGKGEGENEAPPSDPWSLMP
jgi:NADH-quinone oxidoreductase subunit I